MRNNNRKSDSALSNFTLHFEYDKSLVDAKKSTQQRTIPE